MTAHEVLVRARNSIANVGFDVQEYGTPYECGSPRCACGWVAWEAGAWEQLFHPTGTYRDALRALIAASPVEPFDECFTREEGCDYCFDAVEALAFQFDQKEDVGVILAWFDRAISATAPPPPDLYLPELEVAA